MKQLVLSLALVAGGTGRTRPVALMRESSSEKHGRSTDRGTHGKELAMKQLVRSLAVVAMAGSTANALPFYSPDYTFDSTTGTGFDVSAGSGITPDGKAAFTMRYFESNVVVNHLIATWRGPTSLPTPQEDNDHQHPYVRDINRDGWICGFTSPAGGGVQSALWRPDGTRVDLPLLPLKFPDERYGYAFSVNDAGFVAGLSGKYEDFFLFERPVYWTPSFEVVELANPLATSNEAWSGHAGSIGSSGVIAGTVYLPNNVSHAMRWDIDGTALVLSKTTDTGITFTGTQGRFALNDGTIVGEGGLSNARYGVLWTPAGEAIELRNLPSSTNQEVLLYGANNNHYSVGAARNSLGQRVAVRWSPTGEPLALDRLPDAPSNTTDYAYDINDFNFAVGTSYASSAYWRAILWTPDGDAIDMNSLVESDEWILDGATTITNTGWISGAGSFDPTGPAEAYDRPFSILVPFAGTYGMGDANFDESIDFADLLIVAQHYGSSTGGSVDAGDFNLDGVVDFTDLLAIAQNYGDVWGQSVSSLNVVGNLDFTSDWQRAQAMVPEPNVIGGVIGVGLLLLRRR